VGHPRILQGSPGETFVLLEASAGEGEGEARPGSSHLAIVIDRSGSMKGDRIRNAIAGAVEAIDRLADGDLVSVLAFDTTVSTVVPTTALDPSQRALVRDRIRGIVVGGDTCISCGLEEGLRELGRVVGKVDRMILLSDGEPTAGVRTVEGFAGLADQARRQGVSVTTIGVGISYNEKMLGGIAQKAGGDHSFIEDTASLQRVFQAQADKLRATVARDVTATVDLAEGVEVLSVADRTFSRQGRRVVVPLDSFARRDDQTVLLRVRVPTGAAGKVPVAGVSLDYTDVVRGTAGHCEGRLEVGVGADQSEIDGVVGGRVQRTKTADVLIEVNELLEKGKVEEAKLRITRQEQALAAAAASARAAAPASRRADVDNDFKNQAGSLFQAGRTLAKPGPAAAPRAVRENQEFSNAARR
jgi:Ca-activated chloride channel family protein